MTVFFSEFVDLAGIKADCPGYDPNNYYLYREAFTPEECSLIDTSIEDLPSQLGLAGGEVNVDYRRSDIRWIPFEDKYAALYRKIGGMVNQANHNMWRFSLTGFAEKIQYTHYQGDPEKAGKYDEHVDVGADSPHRKISVVVQLSDPADYEGGDLQLYTARSPKIIPKGQGNVAVFPSYMLHGVTPVVKGERKSLVVWASGEPFR